MREIKDILIDLIDPNPDNARQIVNEDESLAFSHDLKDRGCLVPVIVYVKDLLEADKGARRYILLDGHRRWMAARLARFTTLPAIVLSEIPSPAQLHILQMSLEAHKVGLTATERSDLLARILKEQGWTVSQAATNLHMKQPLVSKLLAYQKLDAHVRELLHAGAIDMEKAYVISQEPDAAKQRELAKVAGLSREDLRRHVRNAGTGRIEPKASKASFALSDGAVVSIRRRDLTLSAAVEVLVQATKELRKALAQNLDVTTAQRVLADRAKAKGL